MNPQTRVRVLALMILLGVTLEVSARSAEVEPLRDPGASPAVASFDWPQPQIGPGMASDDRFTFHAAFQTAVGRLHGHQSCRDLFSDLNFDGIRALRLTHYRRAQSKTDLVLCRRGARAVTGVGTGQTRICDAFDRLSRTAKATILIHEALHTAGLSEAPQDPTAPNAREITLNVKTACAL